jgi:hypothetical protein
MIAKALLRGEPVRLVYGLTLLAATAGAGCDGSPEARVRRMQETRAYAEVHITPSPRVLLPQTDEAAPAENFEVYRQTQAHMVKSPFVLNAALRDGDIAKCELLRDQPHAMDYLDEHIEVDVSATEFLMVSFNGPHSKEAAKIVNAVVDAYLVEVANAESTQRAKRASDLEKAHSDLDEEIKKKTRHFKRLQTDLTTRSERQKFALELSPCLRKQVAQTALELIRDRARLAIISADSAKPPPGPDEIDAEARRQLERDAVYAALVARKSVVQLLLADDKSDDDRPREQTRGFEQELAAIEKALAARQETLRERVSARMQNAAENARQERKVELEQAIAANERLTAELHEELARNQPEEPATTGWAVDLDSAREELEQLRGIDREITAQITRLKLEQGAGESRVTLYRKAESP